MTGEATLTGRDIGQAERATRALLDRLLEPAGITFHEWVAMNLLANGGGSVVDADTLMRRVAGSQQIELVAASEAVAHLVELGLAGSAGDSAAGFALTDAGVARYRDLQQSVDQLVERLYRGLAANDLATAHRVLTAITEHANRELASA